MEDGLTNEQKNRFL